MTYLFLFLFSFGCFGQSESLMPKWKEIFDQKDTNREYILKFIIGNGVKLFVMNQGRKVSDQKLGGIQGEKQASFEGDFQYIEKLKEVPSIIIESSALKAVIADQNSIFEYIAATEKVLEDNSDILIDTSYKGYADMISGLEYHVALDMNELELVILKNDLKFKDNERLERLEKMAIEYQDKKKYAIMIYQKAVLEVEYIKSELKSIKETNEYNGTN